MYKVLHVLEGTIGGTRRHVTDLLRHADRAQFQPALAYSLRRADRTFNETLAFCQEVGISCHELPMGPARTLMGNLRAVQLLAKLFRRQKFDVVHAHGAIGGLVGRLATRLIQPPILVYTPNGWPFLGSSSQLLVWLSLKFERWTAAWTDAIICVSNHERSVGQRLRIAAAEKLPVIPNGIDPGEIRGNRQLARAALKLDPHVVVIGTVTRFDYQKDPLGLISAITPVLKANPACQVIVVGNGPLRPAAERLAQQFDVRAQVIFTGFRADATELLFAFDLFVLPSRNEGLAYALLEAMAAGLPVITTAGGNEEAVTDGESGLVVPVGNAAAFTKAVERLVHQPELRERLGRRASTVVREFTIERMVGETEALYRTLLDRRTSQESPILAK